MVHGGRGNAVYYEAGEIEEGLGHISNAEYYYGLAGGKSTRGESRLSSSANNRAQQLQEAIRDSRVHALGRWDCRRMPLRVYIDDGSKLIGYDPALRQEVIDAFRAWSAATSNQLRFQIMPPGKNEGRDVRKDWTSGMKDPGRDIHLHWLPVLAFKDREPLGVTYPHTTLINKVPVIAYTDIYIATNEDATGGTYTAKGTGASKEQTAAHLHQLQYVILHEIGHGIGLEHSVFRSDIMSAIVFGALSSRFSTKPVLSSNDQRSIWALYAGPTTDNPDFYDDRLVVFHADMAETAMTAYNSAVKYYESGHYNNAVLSIQSALRTTPSSPDLHFLLAGCYLKQGKRNNAQTELQLVLKLSPTPQLAEKVRTILSSLNDAE